MLQKSDPGNQGSDGTAENLSIGPTKKHNDGRPRSTFLLGDAWKPIRRRDSWRPRLAAIQCPAVVAIIAQYADTDERVITWLAILEWNTTSRMWRWLEESNKIWRSADDYIIRQLQDQDQEDQVWAEQDLIEGEDGSACICRAVARGWVPTCAFCEGFYD